MNTHVFIIYDRIKVNIATTGSMNALAVQNPRHKHDLENKNDSVTDKKIAADNMNIWQ